MTIKSEILTLTRVWTFAENIDAGLAEEHLAQFMRETIGQKQRQILIDLIWTGAFWATLACAIFVLIFRLSGIDVSIATLLTLALSLSLLGASLIARARRPDDLTVALLADIKLNLNQRLSTAWEFTRTEPGSEVAGRLALQAVKQRLPLPHEPVFPIQLNTSAKLIPIAVALLVLTTTIDLNRVKKPRIIESDMTVVEEGKRLREFAENLSAMTVHETQPQSAVALEKVRRLGITMQSGTLMRRKALIRLRQLGVEVIDHRHEALHVGAKLPLELSESQVTGLTRGIDRLGIRSLLRSLETGVLTTSEAHALRREASALALFGIDQAMLEQALARYDTGSKDSLRQILEKLADIDDALQDASSLSLASTALQRARKNLGESNANQTLSQAEETRSEQGERHRLANFSANPTHSAHLPTSGEDMSTTFAKTHTISSRFETETGIWPQSQYSAGGTFIAEARLQPRVGQPSTPLVPLNAQFSAQMEQVLSKEDYPLHHKAFIRRYFLGISNAVDSEMAIHKKAIK